MLCLRRKTGSQSVNLAREKTSDACILKIVKVGISMRRWIKCKALDVLTEGHTQVTETGPYLKKYNLYVR